MDIGAIRLQTQQITNPTVASAADLLAQLGAVQAQDFAMAKWSLGVRLKDVDEKAIESTFNKGEILRTHVLRPTWHFVAAQDIDWMLRLTAPRIFPALNTRRKELGIDDKLIHQCYDVLGKELAGNNACTKEELLGVFSQKGLHFDSSVFYHLMMCAELDRIVCSGSLKGRKQTYALLAERAVNPIQKSKEEALAELAYRYIKTRGPVTVADFVWWSGLTTSEAKQAFEFNQKQFVMEQLNGVNYWMPSLVEKISSSTFLLPAFDEFLISYRNREALISKEISPKAISSNGIFRPIVVQDGQIAGIWKRTAKPRRIEIEITPFKPFSIDNVTLEIERLSRFWEKEVVLKVK